MDLPVGMRIIYDVTLSCNSSEIWRHFFNFPKQVSARSKSQYLHHNLRYKTSLLELSNILKYNRPSFTQFKLECKNINRRATARSFTEKAGCLQLF